MRYGTFGVAVGGREGGREGGRKEGERGTVVDLCEPYLLCRQHTWDTLDSTVQKTNKACHQSARDLTDTREKLKKVRTTARATTRGDNLTCP